MKREVAECLTVTCLCQQVKIEHQNSAGLLQPLPILKWNWNKIAIDLWLVYRDLHVAMMQYE